MRFGEPLAATWDVSTQPSEGLTVGDRRFRARVLSTLLLATILFNVVGMMLLAGLLFSVKGTLLAGALILLLVAALPLLIPDLLFRHVLFLLGFFTTISVLIGLTARIRRRHVNEMHRQIERQNAVERELLRLKEFNENFVNNMAEGFVVQDADGRFTFVNPAAADLLGYSPDEMVGMYWTRVIPAASAS